MLRNTADIIQRYITADASGADRDTLETQNGTVLIAELDYRDLSGVVLPDGTTGFDSDDVQLAFQNALIKATGMCVLEQEYHRAGFHDLAAMAREARGA